MQSQNALARQERATNGCYRNCYRTRRHGLRSERTGGDTKGLKAQKICHFLGFEGTWKDGESRIRKPMLYPAELRGHSRQSGAPERTTGSDILARRASRQTASTIR